MDHSPRRQSAAMSRRKLLLGGAATAGAVWAAPAVIGVERASAAAFSCVDQTIAWNSVTGTNPWVATGTSGPITIRAQIRAISSPGREQARQPSTWATSSNR